MFSSPLLHLSVGLKRLVLKVKALRLSLPLTEVIKIVSLASQLSTMLRLSSPRLRQGRRLALLSSLILCILSFVLSLALLPHLPPLLTFPTVPLPGSLLRSLLTA